MKQIIILVLLGLSIGIQAQAPTKIGFDAVLRDSLGVPLANQLVTVRLTVNDKSTTEPVFVVTDQSTVMTNARGAFSDVAVGDLLAALNWSTGDLWMRVEVSPNNDGEFNLISDLPLYAVPYAFSANGALNVPDNADGPPGPTGPPGPNGVSLAGPPGPTGVPGPVGPEGPLGAEGITGPTGPVGGTSGSGNTAGPTGPIGVIGPQGEQGIPGEQGIMGPTGIEGLIGNPGATGPPGNYDPMWAFVGDNPITTNPGARFIMRSPDGNCWILIITNGQLDTEATDCP